MAPGSPNTESCTGILVIAPPTQSCVGEDIVPIWMYIEDLQYTVKPPKRGQFGTGGFVLSSEVVLSKRSTILYHILFTYRVLLHQKSQRTELETEENYKLRY